MSKKIIKNKKAKKLDNADKILLGIFGVLIIEVLVLAVIILNKKNNDYQDIKADVIIPIIEKNSNSELSVDVSDMKSGEIKEYIFRISNTEKKKTITENLKYNIVLTKNENVDLKLYKNDNKTNLVSKDNLSISNQTLKKEKGYFDLYRLIIKTTSKANKNDVVSIKITS